MSELEHSYRVGAEKGPVKITRAKRHVHVATEAFAVAAVAPFFFWLGQKEELPEWARKYSTFLGVGTLVVDGGLLITYLRNK